MSVVQFTSSLQLGLTMKLYTDVSYNNTYKRAIELGNEDFLFFQVALQTNNTFASDVLLQVESCWATESTDPEDLVQAVLLQDGCVEMVDWQICFRIIIGRLCSFAVFLNFKMTILYYTVYCLSSQTSVLSVMR